MSYLKVKCSRSPTPRSLTSAIAATAVRQRQRRQWLKDVCYLSSGANR